MPSSCAMRGCKNYDKRFKKEHGVTYHRFPRDPTRKEIWSRILRKQRRDPFFMPAINTRICSAHFCDGDFVTSKTGRRRLHEMALPRYEIEIEVPDKASNSTSAPKSRPALPAQFPISDDPLCVDMSDLNPIFDSPMITHLKEKVERLKKALSLKIKKIDCLRKQNKRLIIKNKLLQDTNKALKQERSIMLDMEASCPTVETKVEKMEPIDSSNTNILLNPPT